LLNQGFFIAWFYFLRSIKFTITPNFIQMKHLLLIASALFLCSIFNDMNAQGFIRGGTGAGFNTNQDAFTTYDITRDSNDIIVSQSTIFGGFGQGARFSLAGGYMFTPHFGIELEIYYFQGFKQNYGSNIGPLGDQYNRKGYSFQVRGLPSLIVQAPYAKFQPYARFGVLIPVFGKTIIEESWAGVTSREKQTDVDGKFSVGIEASMGVQYNINEKIGIYFNVSYTGLRIRSDKATVVKDDLTAADGTVTDNLNQPTSLTIAQEVIFQDELTTESNINTSLPGFFSDFPKDIRIEIDGTLDLLKPANFPTQTSNFNSVSFSLGVKYNFGKKAS
jgi:opacity protein-like surface antigen